MISLHQWGFIFDEKEFYWNQNESLLTRLESERSPSQMRKEDFLPIGGEDLKGRKKYPGFQWTRGLDQMFFS